jgi:hypothetical protein
VITGWFRDPVEDWMHVGWVTESTVKNEKKFLGAFCSFGGGEFSVPFILYIGKEYVEIILHCP